jgi:hypothetical protein
MKINQNFLFWGGGGRILSARIIGDENFNKLDEFMTVTGLDGKKYATNLVISFRSSFEVSIVFVRRPAPPSRK